MTDHQGDLALSDAQKTNPQANEAAGADALRRQYLGTESNPVSKAPAQDAESPAEKRKAEETKYFTEMYQKENFVLDPIQEGKGPFQSLEQMIKSGKIAFSDEDLLNESRRIRNRDFEQLDRDFYNTNEQTRRWTDKEIAQKVKETVDKVKGIDVSSYQNTIDWKQVKDAGYQFAFLKASEGIDWVDPKFATYRAGALEAGLKVGYYHYFRPNDSVDDQVKNFVNTVGKADPGSLRLVIDAEDESMWKPYTVAERVKMIDDWCKGVKKSLGVEPQVSIYSAPNFLNKTLENAPALGKYSLWLANYNVPEPHLPKPWTKWDFWQYTDSGKVPGIEGNVDLDVFNGTDLNQVHAKKRRGAS